MARRAIATGFFTYILSGTLSFPFIYKDKCREDDPSGSSGRHFILVYKGKRHKEQELQGKYWTFWASGPKRTVFFAAILVICV